MRPETTAENYNRRARFFGGTGAVPSQAWTTQRSSLQLERCCRRRALRNQKTHRQHVGFEEAVALEEILGPQLGAIGQQR